MRLCKKQDLTPHMKVIIEMRDGIYNERLQKQKNV